MFNILTLTLDSQILFRQIVNIASQALNHVTLFCDCYLWKTVAAKMLYFLTILRNYPFTEYYSTNNYEKNNKNNEKNTKNIEISTKKKLVPKILKSVPKKNQYQKY